MEPVETGAAGGLFAEQQVGALGIGGKGQAAAVWGQQHLQQCAAQAQFSQACPPGQPGQQLGLPGAPCYDHPPPQPTTDAGGFPAP